MMSDSSSSAGSSARNGSLFARLTALAGALLLGACSGGGGTSSGGTAGALQIVSCSLSCGGGAGASQISCGLNQVALNETIVVDFNQPINLSTVNKNTFQVVDIATGKTPPGSFSLSPANPKRLIFRPAVTFDASGSPVFGFEQQHSYQILIRGTAQDTGGAFISSTGGKENLSRLFCTVTASGIQDPVPGQATAVMDVDVVTATDPVTGDVTATETQSLALGTPVQNVWSQGQLRLSFQDIMNPATLVNPVTGTSPTIKIAIDPDGNTLDAGDQVPIFGNYTINLDQTNLSTTVLFTPSGGWPSSGSAVLKRKVVVTLPPTILDLGGNPISNPGKYQFVPEFVPFDAVLLPEGGEDFSSTQLRDDARTGALWGGGQLLRAKGGGGGLLGPLVVTASNSPYVLDTDSTTFSSNDMLFEGPGDPAPGTAPSKTVTDGVFEFSSLDIEPGGRVVIQGSQPARIFVRGQANVQSAGSIDLSGGAPPDELSASAGHDSTELAGGLGGSGGPGAGGGGQGADRFDDTDLSLLLAGGVSNPGAVNNGRNGVGVAGTSLAQGRGGARWPATHPTNSSDIGMFIPSIVCKVDMVAGPGSGGGYALSGGAGVPSLVDPGLNNQPHAPLLAPPTAGGDAAELGLTAAEMSLDPNLGFLRGGSGGGGGGMQYLRTTTNGMGFPCVGSTALGNNYFTHSAAGGGGGGGALQLQAGDVIRVNGTILANGGRGGSNFGNVLTAATNGQASPGGGGSGGAVLLQSRSIQIAQLAGRITVDGGAGGEGPGGGAPLVPTLGGKGGAGIVRVESDILLDPVGVAPNLLPYNPTPGSVSGGPSSTAFFSSGIQAQGLTGPEGRSGAQSCWIIPDGNFFVLTFAEDDFTDPLNPDLSWDFDVVLTLAGTEPFSFRDVNDPQNPFGLSPETLLGNDLGGVSPSVISVRFQGAHFNKEVTNVCAVDLTGLDGEIDPDSVTPWLRTPSELNTYWDGVPGVSPELASKRRPNMFRYQIVFDGNAPFSNLIAGLTNLYVKGTPD